ncbi:MAG TPA: sigma 54-interacting transcriptional regulator [Polyangiaceae bacterium]|nr:sigma 54-interacting transcriptional regulator [Polyangiaceae bacterium]
MKSSDKSTGVAPTEVFRRESPALAESIARLVVVEGPDRGAALALVRAQATVGRHPTNDLVLHDLRVSSVHLELSRRRGGRVLVHDAGSTNGTWIGDQQIVDGVFGPGVVLRVGDTLLRVEADENTTSDPLAATARFEGLIGATPEMRELFAVLERVAPKALTVLVQGDTGTGKEEVARAVHARSLRSQEPFAVLDATTIPATLAESVLFGHERGAFTGAENRYQGAFERANGGTLFIDEVGELPLGLQPKLLRVLERREITRVGGKDAIPVDVRVIAATHRDLRLEIDSGRFREDLYFRLAQVRVSLPPLRARAEDIPDLVSHFLRQCAEPGQTIPTIDGEALDELRRRPFPGNVRELRNIVARAVALSEDHCVRVGDIAGEGYGFRGSEAERHALDLSGTFAEAKGRAIERLERAYLETLMRRCGGNLSKASREADLARHHLRDLLRKRGLYGEGGGEGGSDGT